MGTPSINGVFRSILWLHGHGEIGLVGRASSIHLSRLDSSHQGSFDRAFLMGDSFQNARRVLVTDCGSTTTKALLFEKTEQGWRQTFRGEAPTTVE